MLFDQFLPALKDKWREVPGHRDRLFSDVLESMSGSELLAFWRKEYGGTDNRDWYRRLYGAPFRGRRVLDVGSGLGFDSVFFAQAGAAVTCCDVAPSNLELIGRVTAELGLHVDRLAIDGLESFDTLGQFDVIWCNGSLLHVPFDAAREECATLLDHLVPGGRWVELAYPRERWVREGSPPFDAWGKMTDGERTPWAEWYDMEKLARRLAPRRLAPVLELHLGHDSFIWLDAEVHERDGRRRPSQVPVEIRRAWRETPPRLWNDAESIALPPFGATDATVEIELAVERGTLGLALGGGISAEAFLDARTGTQVAYLKTARYPVGGAAMLLRNASALGPTRYRLERIEVK